MVVGTENRRSLHYAAPDFLWNLVALANFMRLSLRKGADVVLASTAWQEIRVRSEFVTFFGMTIFCWALASLTKI